MSADHSASPPREAPTRVRYVVLAFCCALAMITYLDRVCFSQASESIEKALKLPSEAYMDWAFFAFGLAYAAFEVPTGWLGDVFGPRKTLIRIVLWWSLFTGLTGLVSPILGSVLLGFWGLVVIRFLFGMGEAGAFPNITRALHNWFPFHERGMAQGIIFMGARFLGGMTPLIWWLLSHVIGLSWRATFWIFAVLGVLWCLLFAIWFRNSPEEKPEVNQAERDLISGGRTDTELGHASVPWLKFLGSGNLWFLCAMYFCTAYGWYFNISYYPRFLKQQFGASPNDLQTTFYAGGPLYLGTLACICGGWLTDWFIRRTGNRKWGRRFLGVICHTLGGLCWLAAAFAPDALQFAVAVSFAAFFNDMTLAPAWSICQDIGKRYSAIVAGCMNTIGNVGGALVVKVIGLVLRYYLNAYSAAIDVPVSDLQPQQIAAAQWPGYQLNFLSFAVIYFIAAFLWLGIDATRPIIPDEPEAVVVP